MNIENKTFRTSDFFLATFLAAIDVSLISIEPTDTKHKVFAFQEIEGLNARIDSFWSGKELIDPLKLLGIERELKRRLYSVDLEGGNRI